MSLCLERQRSSNSYQLVPLFLILIFWTASRRFSIFYWTILFVYSILSIVFLMLCLLLFCLLVNVLSLRSCLLKIFLLLKNSRFLVFSDMSIKFCVPCYSTFPYISGYFCLCSCCNIWYGIHSKPEFYSDHSY